MFFFFFSSRRRHTRWPRDWSSDVCSSDLGAERVDVAGPGVDAQPVAGGGDDDPSTLRPLGPEVHAPEEQGYQDERERSADEFDGNTARRPVGGQRLQADVRATDHGAEGEDP